MAVNRISKDTESRLVDCLEKMAALVEKGSDPTDALVKIARDEDLGPGLVRLMSQAYNNGRTNAQRKSADDLFDKSASFKLADAQAAVRTLYPERVKTAADRHHESAVSDAYSSPPRWTRPAEFVKTASVSLVSEAPAPYPRETDHVKKAFSILRDGRKQVEEDRRLLSETRDKLASAFEDIKTYFRRVGPSVSVKQAQVNARLMFGPAADVLFKQLSLSDSLIEKAASAKAPSPSRAVASQSPYKEIGACIKMARECRRMEESLTGLKKEAAQAARLVNDRFVVPDKDYHAGSILRPMVKEAVMGELGEDIANSDMSGRLSNSGPIGGWLGHAAGGAAHALGTQVFNRVLPKDIDKARADTFMDLTSPQHEAKLRNVRAQAVLHDIMANDEYLSGEHPEKVVKMYNEITKLSPRAADQPMLMRSLLRRYMQQPSVEPHDIDQQLGIENKIKDRDQPQSEFNLPPGGSILSGKKE